MVLAVSFVSSAPGRPSDYRVAAGLSTTATARAAYCAEPRAQPRKLAGRPSRVPPQVPGLDALMGGALTMVLSVGGYCVVSVAGRVGSIVVVTFVAPRHAFSSPMHWFASAVNCSPR